MKLNRGKGTVHAGSFLIVPGGGSPGRLVTTEAAADVNYTRSTWLDQSDLNAALSQEPDRSSRVTVLNVDLMDYRYDNLTQVMRGICRADLLGAGIARHATDVQSRRYRTTHVW